MAQRSNIASPVKVQLRRLITPALITGIAIAALTGCTANAAPTPNITHSAKHTPTAEHTTAPDRYKGSDFERTDPLPAFLTEANAATPDAFRQLPKKIQIQWATWVAQYKPQFIAYLSKVSGQPQDAPYTLTANSDAKALLVDRAYEQRIASSFGEGKPAGRQFNGTLDKDMATKYMMAFSEDDSVDLQNITNFVNSAGENGQAWNVVEEAGRYDEIAEINTSTDFVATPTQMTFGGEAIPCFRVGWTAANGNSANFAIAAYSTVDYKNQPIVVTVESE